MSTQLHLFHEPFPFSAQWNVKCPHQKFGTVVWIEWSRALVVDCSPAFFPRPTLNNVTALFSPYCWISVSLLGSLCVRRCWVCREPVKTVPVRTPGSLPEWCVPLSWLESSPWWLLWLLDILSRVTWHTTGNRHITCKSLSRCKCT